MTERVAVYIDFDNVVISRYDHVHGKGAWRKDDARAHDMKADGNDPISAKLVAAKVDLGAIIDYATSFGIVAMSRAYADWSVPANAAYRRDLVDRAVDLVQLFPASGTKNGADIRLAVDAVEDLARHPHITHVALSPATPTTSPWLSGPSGSAGTSSGSAWPARPAQRWSVPATSSPSTRGCPG